MSRTHNRPVELAAQAIVDLINSQPQSPRQSEIAATIERIMIAHTLPSPQVSTPPNCRRLDEEYGSVISSVRG